MKPEKRTLHSSPSAEELGMEEDAGKSTEIGNNDKKKPLYVLIVTALAAALVVGILIARFLSGGSSDTEAPSETAEETVAGDSETEKEEPASDENAAEEITVFRHGFDEDYLPYSYVDDDGEMTGLDVELAQAVCDYNGWEYEAVPFSWDMKDTKLNDHSCDCIWSGFSITEERKDTYLWSEPYAENDQKIMVKKNDGIEAISDLQGKVVGVQIATDAYDCLYDAGFAETIGYMIAEYTTVTDAYHDFKAGAIDALAIDAAAGLSLTNGEDDYVFLEKALRSEAFGIAFRKEDTALCEKVNAALDALAADGTLEEIGRKYPELYGCLRLNR